MKRLEEYIYEQQIEEQLNEVYDTFLNEDPINEGIIRNALRRAWAWLKSKFNLRRRKYNPYMSDYLAKRAEKTYDYDRYIDADSDISPVISTSHRRAANITTQKTINKLLDNSKLKDKLDAQNQTVRGAELFDDDNKMCGVLVYSIYKTKQKTIRFVVLGLECLKFDDPELYKLLIKIANDNKCASPMYVAKTEYLQNKTYYENQGFKLVDEKQQTNLFYAYKEY